MEKIFLEDVYQHPHDLPPIVAIDLRVQIFLILSRLGKSNSYNNKDDILAYWSKIVNNPLPWLPDHPKGYRVCLLDDMKDTNGNYWRNAYHAAYKKGRAEKSESYNLAHDVITEYLEQEYCPIPVFKEYGFEADDFAGCLFRNKLPSLSRTMFLSTVDTDWLQLVDDERDIVWANCRTHAPRLRTEYEVHNYFASSGYVVYFPEEVIENKYQYGDKTDNYGAGTDKAIIDLRDPPMKPDPTPVIKFLEGTESNICEEHVKRANFWLASRGIGIL